MMSSLPEGRGQRGKEERVAKGHVHGVSERRVEQTCVEPFSTSTLREEKKHDERTADGLANADGEVFSCETEQRRERDDCCGFVSRCARARRKGRKRTDKRHDEGDGRTLIPAEGVERRQFRASRGEMRRRT